MASITNRNISDHIHRQQDQLDFDPPSQPVLAIFIALSVFTFVALMPLPEVFRSIWMTCGAVLLSISVVGLSAASATRRHIALGLAVVTGYLFWALAFPAAINGGDDNGAYLVFARDFYGDIRATIQPLSERRLFSVGGIYAFQAPVIHWFGIRYLSLVEPALGILLFIVAVVTRPKLPVAAALLAIIVIALMPLLGSSALANTASTFIIGSLSLVLILLALAIVRGGRPTSMELAAIVTLPLAALVFRPTTAPFNGLLAGGICLWIVIRNPMDAVRLAVLGLPIVGLFGSSLLVYHDIGGSWLYPLLGRGTHITSEGISIMGSMPLSGHLANIARITSRDIPFLLAMAGALSSLVVLRRNRPVCLAFLAVTVIFLIFAASVVIATSGLASGRYITPVSFSMIVVSLIVVGEASSRWSFLQSQGFTRFAPLALLGVLLVLLLGARVAGHGVAERRLLQHELTREQAAMVRNVGDIINSRIGSSGAVVLVDISEARFLIPSLQARVLLMDQPGMLVPWRQQTNTEPLPDYTTGLTDYLARMDTKAIVVKDLSCAPQPAFAPAGWADLMRYGVRRNTDALCEIAKTAERIDLGNYTVLFPHRP